MPIVHSISFDTFTRSAFAIFSSVERVGSCRTVSSRARYERPMPAFSLAFDVHSATPEIVMPRQAALIAVLFHEAPTCLECAASKSALTVSQVNHPDHHHEPDVTSRSSR